MFRGGSVQKNIQNLLKNKLIAQCDGLVDTEPSVPTLVEQVGDMLVDCDCNLFVISLYFNLG